MHIRRLMPYLLLVVLLPVVFIGGYVLGQAEIAPLQLTGPAATTPESAQESFRPFWEVWQILQADYFSQPIDNDILTEGAIDGMLAVLDDPNTRYLSPEEEESNRLNFEGEFEGIGAEVTIENDAIVVVAPFEGSPAALAGIKPGDILRQADSIELTGMDLGEAAKLVRGPAGSTVHLVIERDGSTFELEVVRDAINIPSVRGEVLDDGIAYIRLSRFSSDTVDELEQVLKGILSEDPIGMILDLRSNPGGGLSTAVDIADHFLDEGPILVERFGNGEEIHFSAEKEGLVQEIPLVLLIDEGSASASEVVAGSIQDRGRGTLIGNTSFGKGTVQTWHQLSNDGGLRVTVARWLTPNGTWVHGDGLVPDITIVPDESDEAIQEDVQLQAAIDHLLGRPGVDSEGDG